MQKYVPSKDFVECLSLPNSWHIAPKMTISDSWWLFEKCHTEKLGHQCDHRQFVELWRSSGSSGWRSCWSWWRQPGGWQSSTRFAIKQKLVTWPIWDFLRTLVGAFSLHHQESRFQWKDQTGRIHLVNFTSICFKRQQVWHEIWQAMLHD